MCEILTTSLNLIPNSSNPDSQVADLTYEPKASASDETQRQHVAS